MNAAIEKKPRFLKFRNKYGQVSVAYMKKEDGLHLGCSFCNPKDFNLPRKKRIATGEGIARSHLYKEKHLIIPNLSIDTNSKDLNHLEFRKYILNSIERNLVYTCKSYKGMHSLGEFNTWFFIFLGLELKKIFEKINKYNII